MKFIHYFTLSIISLILINIFFPATVYALSPEDIQDVCNVDKIIIEHYLNPEYYWNDSDENDVYARHQKSKYLNKDNIYYPEPKEYPISVKSFDSQNDISKFINYKYKFVWFAWKKYDKEFESLESFKKSSDQSFSIRSQLKKDLKKSLYK